MPNGRLGAEESAVLLFLLGEGLRLLRGEAAVATEGAATRFSGAEAQVAAAVGAEAMAEAEAARTAAQQQKARETSSSAI